VSAAWRKGRSRLSNGSKLLPGVDGRSPWVRRCKDIIAVHLSDLGGVDNCSAVERSIIRRAAVLTTELERLEAQFAAAGRAEIEDLDAYARIAANLRVAVAFDEATQRMRLCTHRVFQPSPDDPLDFEQTIERTLQEWSNRFQLRRVLYDPWQMQAVAQRLTKSGLPMHEFPQSQGNTTLASQCLYELINGHNLTLYPDAGMRLAASRTVAKETGRGWRITKEKSAHKIDQIVAVALACHCALEYHKEPFFDRSWAWVEYDDKHPPPQSAPSQAEHERKMAESRQRLLGYLAVHGP
jgi:hypothetical protein